jgi:hypothetical protein
VSRDEVFGGRIHSLGFWANAARPGKAGKGIGKEWLPIGLDSEGERVLTAESVKEVITSDPCFCAPDTFAR